MLRIQSAKATKPPSLSCTNQHLTGRNSDLISPHFDQEAAQASPIATHSAPSEADSLLLACDFAPHAACDGGKPI